MFDPFRPNLPLHEVLQLSALALAHCGDAVFELMVRSSLCADGTQKALNLHRATVACVRAGAQSARMERILPHLTEQETAIYKRGRNAHVHSVPKGASRVEYARATGLECLFGALYLSGRLDRLDELFSLSSEERHAT